MSKIIQPIAPRYSRELLLASPDLPEFCFFWGHTPDQRGVITQSCLSQWWKADFTYNDVRYCCMEQCMMAGKARLFDDDATLEEIMASDDPKVIKALGRKVQGFQEDAWNEIKYALIVAGNYSKFSQNVPLREFLLSTGDAVLVEASPYDRIWGIGLPASDPLALEPASWRGQNLLGFALMEVRDQIRSSL
ncbi:MAG: NADAR family protein [Clostridiales bacterium]|nr:NADAR family protein [Clostridiales bacterium]